YGVDVHPFVSKIAKAKLAWDVDITELRECFNHVISSTGQRKLVSIPSSPLAKKCFPDDDVFHDLLKIRDGVLELDQCLPISKLVWLAFVGIIRATSPAGTAQWQYILPNRTKSKTVPPFFAFEKNMEIFISDIQSRKTLDLKKELD
ncbi:hypothetical protein, partial [Klebsiella pneumoniae]